MQTSDPQREPLHAPQHAPQPTTGPPRSLVLSFPGSNSPSQTRAIPREGFILGRGESVFDRPFADPTMALRHAEILLHGNHATLGDLGSGSNTWLNGVIVREVQPLKDGDVVRVGDTLFIYTRCERLAAAADRPGVQAELTGTSPSIVAVRRSIEAVAPHARTVVVSGETGTGKEIVSRMLHDRSGRSGPFVAVNCGGFTEGLLASELFGHVRGAFTGALSEQPGLFRAARGGTLLLDEVGEMPMALQPTLLRVLETWHVRPVGSAHDVAIDVRVVAASNRELIALVQQGKFRSDLYARLAQWFVRIPPLRDRRGDIPALVRALLKRLEGGDRDLTADLQEALMLHPWPLNVRGLSNVIAIALIASPVGEPLGLFPEVRAALQDNKLDLGAGPPPVAPPKAALEAVDLDALLHQFGGRVAAMARHAGVSRPKMYRMLWAAGLDPASFRDN
jgi:DNA-binding NtrC family response regulator